MELPSTVSLPCPQATPGATCTCRGLGVPTSPYTHRLAETLPTSGCQGAARQGGDGVSSVLLAASGSSCVGHLRHLLQRMGGSRQGASHPLCQLSIHGFFPGKAKPMTRSGAGNICIGGKGDAWSGMDWGVPCLGPLGTSAQRMQQLGNPMARSPPRLMWHHLMLWGLAPARALPWAS